MSLAALLEPPLRRGRPARSQVPLALALGLLVWGSPAEATAEEHAGRPAPASRPAADPEASRPRAHLALDTTIGVIAGATWLGLEIGLSSLTRTSCPCYADTVGGFDRQAIYWDFGAGLPLSHVAAGLAIAGPVAALWAIAPDRRTAVGDSLLVLQSTVLAGLLTEVVKIAVSRPYPYLYRADVTREQIEDGRNYASFWSGHTVAPMAAAVSFAAILQRRAPRSAWRWVAWVVGPALAVTSGLLQMSDANHFPTDVIAGAAVGATVGYVNVWLHDLGGD